MKTKMLWLWCLLMTQTLAAQDVIVTAKAERIEALITEVSPTEIRYKKWEFQDGPTFIVSVKDLSAIIFKNGEVQLFNQKSSAPTAHPTVATEEVSGTHRAATKAPYNPSDAASTASTGIRRYITDTRFQGYLYCATVFDSGTVGPAFDVSLGVRVRDFFYIGFQTGTHVLIPIEENAKLFYVPLAAHLKVYVPVKKYIYPNFDCAIGGMAGRANIPNNILPYNPSFGGFYCSAGLGIDAGRFSAGVGYIGLVVKGEPANLGYIRIGVYLGRK